MKRSVHKIIFFLSYTGSNDCTLGLKSTSVPPGYCDVLIADAVLNAISSRLLSIRRSLRFFEITAGSGQGATCDVVTMRVQSKPPSIHVRLFLSLIISGVWDVWNTVSGTFCFFFFLTGHRVWMSAFVRFDHLPFLRQRCGLVWSIWAQTWQVNYVILVLTVSSVSPFLMRLHALNDNTERMTSEPQDASSRGALISFRRTARRCKEKIKNRMVLIEHSASALYTVVPWV